MIVIEKGAKTLEVSKSAYENFYRNAGWHSVEGSDLDTATVALDDVDEDAWDKALSEEEPTKPLSEMNRAELEAEAKRQGVSLAGLSSNKQIRDALRADAR